jgi:hypothetical protein
MVCLICGLGMGSRDVRFALQYALYSTRRAQINANQFRPGRCN